MEFPSDLKYTKEHEWVRVEGDLATVGITAFAQSELGDLVFVELPELGKEVHKGDTLCVVESTKAASDVYAPVGGIVAESNTALNDSPEKVNTDPYGEGWIAKLKEYVEEDLQDLMSADEYREYLGEKI